ncbi:oxidoreductase [Novosphingobium lentum]|uniref:oxidoreductase n=1 Tax=Novosphingobium lentum TaxID=145287 RepID=UPI0008298808|nr:oxidoreductase [Novosphingobium lentum]
MDAVQQRRWFITGISTGFGRELARAVVAAGDKVLGTVRTTAQMEKLAGEGIGAILMDVNDQAAVEAGVQAARARLGGVDVLVNNAGFGMVGAIEALALDEVRSVMETNFFGALRVTQAFIPAMRASGGTIVMISSMAGQVGFAGAGAYCASKFALEGLSDALGEELAPFGVDVLIVEPGAFRTDFAGRSMHGAEGSVDAYAGMQAGEAKKWAAAYSGTEPGDPVKGAQAIIDVIRAGNPPRRLALGADAVVGILAKLDNVRHDLDAWRDASLGTAFA